MAAVLLSAGGASAQTLTVTVPTFTGPVENAVTVGADSALTFQVSHTATRARYRIDFQLPNSGYAALGGSAGPAGWTVSQPNSQTVRFTAPCSGAGLPRGTSASFTVRFRVPAAAVNNDTTTSAFRVTATTQGSGSGCRTAANLTNSSATARAKVLAVSDAGTALAQLAPPAVVRWNLANYSRAQKTGVTVTNRPAGSACAPGLTLAAYAGSTPGAGVLRCTYPATAGQPLALGGTNATGSTAPATAVGTTIGAIDVGDAYVSWSRSTLVRGRSRDPIVLEVVNDSRATISRVDVVAPSSGWVVAGALSDGGLSYAPASSSDSVVAFTGTLAAGARSTLTIRYASLPGSGDATARFQVRLTPSSGADYAVAFAHDVTVRAVSVFPPDVSRLTVRSFGGAQTLSWVSPATHAGVVILRAEAPAWPSPPVDFVDYALDGSNPEVAFVTADPSVSSATDPRAGAFNYVVCNHDAAFVYADCRTDVAAGRAHYAGSSAAAPVGGWTDQLGGEALGMLQVFAAGRTIVPTSRGDASVLNLADGSRAPDLGGMPIAPVPLSSTLPSTYTPAWRLADGRLLAVAADQYGWITAIDLEVGAEAWRVQKPGESFTAGVSGVSAAGGSAAFRQAYPGMDVVFLGSATSGRVLAIDAASGATLWSVGTGTGNTVNALTTYDPATNFLWVPTATGVQAFDLGPSRPDADHPASLVWSRSDGPHTMYCVRTTVPTAIACADVHGRLRVLQKADGALLAQVDTGVSLPTMLVRVAYGTPGFVVGGARRVARVDAADATLTALTLAHFWEPAGWTLSPFLLFSASGYLIVGASDLTPQGVHLYKRSSEDLAPISTSPDVQPANPRTLVGQPSYDAANGLYFFGTEEGRVWAIPASSV